MRIFNICKITKTCRHPYTATQRSEPPFIKTAEVGYAVSHREYLTYSIQTHVPKKLASIQNNVRETLHSLQEHFTNITDQGSSDIVNIDQPIMTTSPVVKKYDVLINSYMNSGSRFTGQLFGFRKDAFYIYEPLWKFSVFNYFRPQNLVCSTTQGSVNCGTGNVQTTNRLVPPRGRAMSPGATLVKNIKSNISITDLLLESLNSMYNCDFSRIENLFVPNVHDATDLAGPAWLPFKNCMRRKPKSTCLKEEEKRCKNASHVVTKVLRLTNSAYDKLLASRPNLKLIHLFRNPFAVVNSRTESKGYPVKDFSANAAILCKKMEYDYQEGLILLKKYPDRVKFVFYEDIKSDVQGKIEKLYEYVGMDLDHSVVKTYNKVKTNKGNSNTPTMAKTRTSDNAHWWRSHMTFLRYQQTRDKCRTMMALFNLTDFKDRNQLMNMSIQEMNLRPHLLI
ncbi:hypothetical protein ACF0H5_013057 [Mactra antiquata]